MRINTNVISNLAFTAASVVIVVLGGLQIWDRVATRQPASRGAISDVTPVNMPIKDVPQEGDTKAKVVLIEFSDFQCPFCGSYAKETYASIKREFVTSGKVKYAFVNFPLGSHPYAQGAAEAAECAHAQGQFWPMHDRLFAQQQLLSPSDLKDHAKEIGLDAATFQTCLSGAKSQVNADVTLAKRLGVESTPTFLIGTVNPDGTVRVTKKIVGANPVSVFREALGGMTGG